MLVVGKRNIAYEQTNAIVNSTSGEFAMNGEISQAIGKRAGDDWLESCKRIGKLNDVYMTDAPNLDCDYVMHLRAPSNIEECRKVAIRALQEAISMNIKSISFPMIGGGGMGLKHSDVAQAISEVVIFAADEGKLTGFKLVRFVAIDDKQFELFVSSIKNAIQKASTQQLVVKSAKFKSAGSHSNFLTSLTDLPTNWMPMQEHELCLQIKLEPGQPEFQKIKTLFEAEKKKHVDTAKFCKNLKNRTLMKVFRLQNPTLYRQYVLWKEKFAKKYHNKSDVVKNLERTLFHGTSEDTVSKINSEGFDRSFCGKNMTLYGKGVYFARDLSYSCDQNYSPPNSDNVKCIYVVKALVGVITLGTENMPNLPEQSHDVPFDCAVDSTIDPTVFAIFRDFQAYPEYLMHIV